MNQTSNLRGAIVGCGYFAQHHLEAWRRVANAQIVAAADADIERARAASPSAYSSGEELLASEKLDFVDIVTRPETHLPLLRAAASRGVHVICQKPMAPSCNEARAMVTCAHDHGVRLMIHDNWRWQPWYRAASSRIAAGDIGRPLGYGFRHRRRDGTGDAPYVTQPYFRKMPRLLIYETLVHHIDTARFLFGHINSVYALTRRRNPRIAGEDQALLLLSHVDGVDGSIDGHRFLDPLPDGPVAGDAIFEGDEGLLKVLTTGDILLNDGMVWTNEVASGYRGDSVHAAQRHFIECLLSGAEFETDGLSYLNGTYQAVEAAYASVASGNSVRL